VGARSSRTNSAAEENYAAFGGVNFVLGISDAPADDHNLAAAQEALGLSTGFGEGISELGWVGGSITVAPLRVCGCGNRFLFSFSSVHMSQSSASHLPTLAQPSGPAVQGCIDPSSAIYGLVGQCKKPSPHGRL
jgi:hypothetical protein